MALDRQRILSELGNVMSQLQSADCGCMGKLFSNPGSGGGSSTLGSPLPTCSGCRHGCCHGHGYNQSSPHVGYGGHCAGETYNPSVNYQSRCNPHKSYFDTYNYLNQNIMQPVMEDVYNDLNSLSQANTVSNNPLANQMGIAAAPGQSPMMSSPEGQVGNMNTNAIRNHDPVISSMQYGNKINMQSTEQAVNIHNQVPQNINGMGSADMVYKGNASISGTAGQGGKLTVPMIANAHQTPHGQVGITPFTATSHNQNQYVMNMSQENNKVPNTNTQNNILGFNKHGHMQNDALNYTQQTNKLKSNPTAQQVAAAHNHYGHHNTGIKKFNEMFPGVMQGSGGDLGFDPMSIAVQMNPANRQNAFMNRNVEVDKLLKPAINETNGEAANIAQPKSAVAPQQNIPLSNNKNSAAEQEQIEQNYSEGQNIGESFAQQQQILTAQVGDLNNNKQKLPQPLNRQSPNFQQYQPQQSQPNAQIYQQQQNNIDPNLSGVTSYQNQNDNERSPLTQDPHSNQPLDSISQQQVKEHLLPVDTSRYLRPISMKQQRSKEYNTLGQPVEILPAEIYYRPEPTLPQTLSPQDAHKRLHTNNYSNVKSTISKTSLMGNRRASRSQLQHVYNQYKGSQSFTQQNVNGHHQAGPKTASEGKLGIPSTPQQIPQVPVERVGGDMISTNNQGNTQIPSNQEPVGKLGDHVTMNKPHGDIIPDKKAPRNGIQDLTFPTYTSCSWSFQRPVPTAYGHGNQYRR